MHSGIAWKWLSSLGDDEVLYCRMTQLGILRLLTTEAVMAEDCLTIKQAWRVYDQWLRDSRVSFRHESSELDPLFRQAAILFSQVAAPKVLGDCYLLAFSEASNAVLVTLDAGLSKTAKRIHRDVVLLT